MSGLGYCWTRTAESLFDRTLLSLLWPLGLRTPTKWDKIKRDLTETEDYHREVLFTVWLKNCPYLTWGWATHWLGQGVTQWTLFKRRNITMDEGINTPPHTKAFPYTEFTLCWKRCLESWHKNDVIMKNNWFTIWKTLVGRRFAGVWNIPARCSQLNHQNDIKCQETAVSGAYFCENTTKWHCQGVGLCLIKGVRIPSLTERLLYQQSFVCWEMSAPWHQWVSNNTWLLHFE